MSDNRDVLRPAILALGIVIAGLLIGGGFARSRNTGRYVTVKGIYEREVKADLAIWPLRIVAGGIRRAYQGVFEILRRDQADGITEASQVIETVRVVSTIDYALNR